jgi:hypothetical protein
VVLSLKKHRDTFTFAILRSASSFDPERIPSPVSVGQEAGRVPGQSTSIVTKRDCSPQVAAENKVAKERSTQVDKETTEKKVGKEKKKNRI